MVYLLLLFFLTFNKMKQNFLPVGKLDTLKDYIFFYSNPAEAEGTHLNNFPERNQFLTKCFGPLPVHFKQYTVLIKPILSRNKPGNEENEINALLAVIENTEIFVR